MYFLQSYYLFFLFLNTSAANNATTPNNAVVTELRPVLGNFLSLLETLAVSATFSLDLTLSFSTPYTWVVIPSFLDVETVLYPLRTLGAFSPSSTGASSLPTASIWRVTTNSSLTKTGAPWPFDDWGFSASNLYVFESTFFYDTSLNIISVN